MNKTISINIAGFVFNIEEQAYEKLSRYLESIKSNFQNEADCEEIMTDIESRIAELFHEKISESKEVIIETDVAVVISVMGEPEEFLSEETADNFTAEDHSTEEDAEFVEAEDVKSGSYRGKKDRKRLYRDESSSSIGGVCAGLGWFFGIDPVLIRIGFILLTVLGGSGVLLYIILWIVIPQAKTTAEILEMQGEAVTLDSIKDHVQGAKTEFKKGARDAKNNIKSAVNKGVKAGGHIAGSLSKVFGTVFVIGGITALLLLIIVLFGNTGLLPLVGSDQIENLQTLLTVIYPAGRSSLVFFAIIIVTLIPIISGIFLGIKLLFGIKGSFKKTSISVSIIWFLGVGVLTLTGIELGMNFRDQAQIDFDVPVTVDSSDVLFVDVREDDIFSNYIEYQHVWNYSELIKVDEEKIFLGYPELRIVEKGDSGAFNVMLYKESRGLYQKEAIARAEKIHYELNTFDNAISLSPYFSIDTKDKMRNQKVIVEIHVPIGKRVKFGENIDRILVDVSGERYDNNDAYANTTWIVSDQGFKCLECEDRPLYNDEFDN